MADLQGLAWGHKHGGNNSVPTVFMSGSYGEFMTNWAYDDAESVVATFMLVRGRHWFLGVPPFPGHETVPPQLQLDWGAPRDAIMRQAGATAFERAWEGGVARFDCATQSGSLAPSRV